MIVMNSNDFIYSRKRNSLSKVKMISHMYKKNPIPSDINLSQPKINEDEIRQRKARNYLDSSNIKENMQQQHTEKTFPLKKSENADIQGRFLVEQSKAVNPGQKKFLRNSTHLFEGKTGYYM
jgi:hypothetical protein